MDELINKDLIQSYTMTASRFNFGIYSQRLLVRICEATQSYLAGRRLGSDDRRHLVEEKDEVVKLRIPVKDVLPVGDRTNYTAAKEQIKALQSQTLEYEDSSVWYSTVFLNSVKFIKGESIIELVISSEVWYALMDFSRGFTRYELAVAFRLKSAYSLRFYQIISNNTRPISYDYDDLVNMLGLKGRYRKPSDFRKRVIEPVKKELDSCSPWTFTFEEISRSRNGRGRNAIVGFVFKPVYQSKYRDPELQQRELSKGVSCSGLIPGGLSRETKDYMMNTLEFSFKEIQNNLYLLDRAADSFDLDDFLRTIAPRALRTENPKGYVINAVKSELDSVPQV